MKKFLHVSKISIICLCGIMVLYILYSHFQISKVRKSEAKIGAEYIIVLGAKVIGETPSLSLRYRIEAAAKYLKNSPNTVAIVSGGQGPGEDDTEAQVMKNELVSLGIDESRILKEDKSTSTYENLSFSKKLIDLKDSRVIVVTNGYHLYRSMMIGEQYDLQLEPLAAKTPKVALVKSYGREYLAILKYHLLTMTNNL